MNITGESFDYGPYRFLPKNDPNFTRRLFRPFGASTASAASQKRCSGTCSKLAACFTLVTEQEGFDRSAETAFGRRLPDRARRRYAETAWVSRRRAAIGMWSWRGAAFRALGRERRGGRRSHPLGAVLLRLVSAVRRRKTGAMGGPPRRAFTRVRPSPPSAPRSPSYEPDRPERFGPPATSPRPSRRSCSTTKSRRSGPPSPRRNDWTPFKAKLEALDKAREAMALSI